MTMDSERVKIAVIGDLHLASPLPPSDWVSEFYAERHPVPPERSFDTLCQLIREEAPDLTVCLGDAVDWHSEANLDFALDWFSRLPGPWALTPGNHELQVPERGSEGRIHFAPPGPETERSAREAWTRRGIEIHSRYYQLGDLRLLLLDSASEVISADAAVEMSRWLDESITPDCVNIVITHKPVELDSVLTYLLSTDAAVTKRRVWVPEEVFRKSLRGRVHSILSGHVHYQGSHTTCGVDMYFVPRAIPQTGKLPAEQRNVVSASAIFIEKSGDQLTVYPKTIGVA